MAEGDWGTSLSALNFTDDLEAMSATKDAARWKLDRRGRCEVWITVSPADAPTEKFIARLFWNEYPGTDLPPSVKFVDLETKRLDLPKAWPKANGFRPQSLDICANWTAEGFALHPEWKTTHDRWDTSGNVVLKVARILQSELDHSYTGRFDG